MWSKCEAALQKLVKTDVDWESQLWTKAGKQWRNQEQPDRQTFPMFVLLISLYPNISENYVRKLYWAVSDATTANKQCTVLPQIFVQKISVWSCIRKGVKSISIITNLQKFILNS